MKTTARNSEPVELISQPEYRQPEFEALVDELHERLLQGDDPNERYVPHLRAVHSRSRGYAQRVPGSLVPRVHDFLSRNEFHLFLLFDWRRNEFANIREQFALPLPLTCAIAKREGIRHPIYRGKKAVMSIDFLLTKRGGGWTAVDFKERKDLAKPRAKRKLDLAGIAIATAGVEHVVMTEDDIPMGIVRNLRFLRIHTLPFDAPPLGDAQMNALNPLLEKRLRNGRTTIFDAAQETSKSTQLPASKVSRACYWFIANRHWAIDLNKPVGPDFPLTFID